MESFLTWLLAKLAAVDWAMMSIKLGVLFVLLLAAMRLLARYYGVHNSFSPREPITIALDRTRGKQGGGAIIRLPLNPLNHKFGRASTQFHGVAANVTVALAEPDSTRAKHDLGSFILEVPERHTGDEFWIDRDTWGEVRAALEPDIRRGPPRRSYQVTIDISDKGTRGIVYLLTKHPDREARQSGVIVLLSGLIGIAGAALFGG